MRQQRYIFLKVVLFDSNALFVNNSTTQDTAASPKAAAAKTMHAIPFITMMVRIYISRCHSQMSAICLLARSTITQQLLL